MRIGFYSHSSGLGKAAMVGSRKAAAFTKYFAIYFVG